MEFSPETYLMKDTNEDVIDCLLYHVYTPVVLKTAAKTWNILPFYVREEVPADIQKLIFSDLSPRQLEKAIHYFWLQKAVKTLRAYQNADVPFSKDPRVVKQKMDLLSNKGHEVLQFLSDALAKGNLSSLVLKNAIKASHKFMLDTNLFIQFDDRLRKTLLERPQKGRVILSMSSGCYNNCSHCGFCAKTPVSHMPYPLLLNLIRTAGSFLRDDYGVSMFYSDSDPISYNDPIIEADGADVRRYVSHCLPLSERLYFALVTKGVFSERDKRTIAKAFEVGCLTMSYVDLPGEKSVEKNEARINETFKALEAVPAERCQNHLKNIWYFSLQDNLQKAKMRFPAVDRCERLKPRCVGRWAQTWQKYKLKGIDFGRTDGFIPKEIVVSSNGQVWDISLNRESFCQEWKRLGSVFEFQKQKD